MSASSHTRGHRFAPEQTSVLLAWLERHSRRVVNGSRALRLEVNKAAQYSALNAHGIRTPRTVAAAGHEAVIEAARAFGPGPVILKPNRGGKGHGVRLFETASALRHFVASDAFEQSIDGILLLQEYVRSPEQYITRVEFIGGEFFYAVRVDTGGSFELCPADQCATADSVDSAAESLEPQFSILDTIDAELVQKYRSFLAANDVAIGAIEFIMDTEGRAYTYDVNTNTNYNAAAETRANRYGMHEVARFLGREFAMLQTATRQSA
jgi:biotin carboxylase